MHRAPTRWSLAGAGAGGFAPVPQIDALDECGDGDQRQPKWTSRDFSSQVRQVPRHSAIHQEQESDHMSVQGSVHSSPAFSDTTLVGGDYLDVPTHHYDEVDLGNCIEYHGYYGPEVASLPPTPSIKAGVGLEVCSGPVSSYLTPGGLYVDDPWSNISYRGSEGRIEEKVPGQPQDYKPPVLRMRFLVILLFILAILVALAELAIQLLPNDSGIAAPSRVVNDTVDISPRSIYAGRIGLFSTMTLFKRQNNTSTDNPAPETTTSVTSSIETIPNTAPTTGNEITTATSPTSTSSNIPTFPGEDVSTDTIETSTPSITIPDITSFSKTSPWPISSTSTSITLPLPPPSSSTTVSQTEPPPPPPASTTSEDNLPPPVTSSSISSPSSSFIPPTLPGHQEPTSSYESSSPTSGDTTTSKIGDPWPSHTLDPTTFTSSTSIDGTGPPFTLPTWPTNPHDPSSSTSSTGPPNSGPTNPDSTPAGPTLTLPTLSLPPLTPPTSTSIIVTLPTLTLPSLPLPPSSNSPGGPGSDTPTTSKSLPFPSSTDPPGTTTDPPGATTLPDTSTSSTKVSSTRTSPPGNDPSSNPIGPTEPMSSTEPPSSSSSSSTSSSTIAYTTNTDSLSHSTSYIEPPSTSSTLTTSSSTHTMDPLPSIPEPIATITISPDTQSPPPPITTTMVTSIKGISGNFIETTLVSVINVLKANADDALTEYVTVLSDSNGRPTMTTTFLAQVSRVPGSVFIFQAFKTTLTDYQGRGTKTEDYYISQSTQILYDTNHHPTATRTLPISETISLITLRDGNGVATETKTELVPISSTTTLVISPTLAASPISKENKTLHVVPISDGKYFLGLMLPTLVAILVSIPIRIIDQTAKLYQPFYALVSSRGTKACDTLCFPTAGTWSLAARIRALLNGQVLLTLTGLLVLGSVVMIPLSSEAVGIILTGPECAATRGDTLVCKMALGVYSVRAQIAVALLALMAVLVGLIIVVLRKWNTGVSRNPWSLFEMVHLAANNEIKTLVQRRLRENNGRISNREVNKALAGISFVLDYWRDNGDLKYSILIPNEAHSWKKDGKTVTFRKGKASRRRRKGNTMPFFILTWTGRLLFLALLCAVEIGLLTYTITGDGQGYTEFMMGRWRVVRFIFTFIGVMISLLWGFFFQAIAFLIPHKLFHRIRLYNGDAGKMTPPTNVFSGIRSSLTPGRRDVYLGLVSVTSILSEILPLLLSISLDKCTETFWAHRVCLWMAVSLLGIMMFTVAGSFFVTWPRMPIDPSTIAGGLYYALTKYMPMSPSSGLLFGRRNLGLV